MSNPIQPTSMTVMVNKPLTKKQKVAIAAGATVATVALGSAVAAYAVGRKTPNAKFFGKLKAGYSKIFSELAELTKAGWKKLTGLFKGGKKVAEETVKEAPKALPTGNA